MTIREFYEQIDGDFASVLERFGEELGVTKYLAMFIREDMFSKLEEAMKNRDYEEAFRVTHSMKGVTLNLGLSPLEHSSREMCEALRNGKVPDNIDEMFEQVRADNERVVEAIHMLDIGGNKNEKIEVSNERLIRILNSIANDADAFFLDGVDANLNELNKCKLNDRLSERFEELRTAVDTVSMGIITKIAHEMIKEIEVNG